MELLNPIISIDSPAIPFLTWKTRKNPSRLVISNPRKLPLRPSFSLYLSRPIPSRKFQISAHFGRHSNRQSYLRKKLTQQQLQLQQVRRLQNPLQEFDKVDLYDSEFDISGERSKDIEKRSSFGISSEESKDFESSSLDNNYNGSASVKESETELREKQFGESIMWKKLESWVEQNKKDMEFWGIGSGPIFTIFQDSEGKVERVVVDEDEILRRSRVDPQLDDEADDLGQVNYKISFAKDLAREMENGSNVIPKNSSVAKFLVSGGKSRLMEAILGVTLRPGLFSRMSRVGVLLLCGFSVVWAIRGLLTVGKDSKEYTRLEKEMLRRKIRARTESEKMVKGSVEVMQDPVEPKSMSFGRPQLDKDELVNSIIKVKRSSSKQETVEYNKEFKDKIEEIRAMARHAREIERRDSLPDDGDGEDYQTLKELADQSANPENDLPVESEEYDGEPDETTEATSFTNPKEDIGQSADRGLDKKGGTQCYDIPNVVTPNGNPNLRTEVSNKNLLPKSSDLNEENQHADGPGCQSGPHENSSRKKLRIIKSAKEAREYLSRKHRKLEANQMHEGRNDEQTDIAITMASTDIASSSTSPMLDLTDDVYESSPLSGLDDFSHPSEDNSRGCVTAVGNFDSLNGFRKSRISSGDEVSISNENAGMPEFGLPGKEEKGIKASENFYGKKQIPFLVCGTGDSTSNKVDRGGSIQAEEVPTPPKNFEDAEKNETFIGLQVPGTTSSNEVKDRTEELAPSVNKETWIEKNFDEFEPIVKKIAVGFRDNYLVAREKTSQELDSVMQLKSAGAENELEWMKDERLREIVFKVRDNELSGRDPFHLMSEDDKSTFFSGLEKKVEQENEKLLNLHEYLHSNIENLDYGADGISLYDPPEKIIPRWKVPPAEKNPEFLNNFLEERKALVAESLKNSFLMKKTGKDVVHKAEEPSSSENSPVAADVSDQSTELQKDTVASSKTLIEGSDGSIRAGKKTGREYWQHTKKWSQEFLESYNAETNPEVKAVMKDIGKDLDRWITEKEIQEAADLMNKVPRKGQKSIKQKLDKVKREMELFGPQAVVSKYREYAEEKEEDYLWWLDLPFVLCIELYTQENAEQRVGFYSLEMAADLELDPKQYHVIAFEDSGDCKKLCYIIQAHMEMLGNGNAFVVARPPKDAYREAKANGFSVTVIRKGQLQLNVDQTLEEVEELIMEIGSKIYHDKITKERSVDINALMKGVFGVSKPAKRKRSKRKPKRRIKP
ncbi:uncharacterized protein LOC105173692 [Sesamum indicum]|uniref:Uncharacterized protein LOC105173692 n=1 Tax=Sesamum indicum TaxID=4182 RepID=A0A6I9U829_SESIN|nr:uncharacterized protein LOC105173692 [Sesamum indicum]